MSVRTVYPTQWSILVLVLFITVKSLPGQIAPGVGRYIPTLKSDKNSKPRVTSESQLLPSASFPSDITMSAGLKLFLSLPGEPSESQKIIISAKAAIPRKIGVSSYTDPSGNQVAAIPAVEGVPAGSYTISDIAIGGDDGTDFTVNKCESGKLDNWTPSCELEVTYKPMSAKRSDATLTLDLVPTEGGKSVQVMVPLIGVTYASCDRMPGYIKMTKSWYIPLPLLTASNSTINCYYNTNSTLSFVTQASYLYNPSGSANSVAGDLASLNFRGGFELTLEGTATTSSCNTPVTNASQATGSACSGTATDTNTSQPSLAQDVQSITQGGDFGIKVLWPIVSYNTNKFFQLNNIVAPRVGFSVNGLSATATSTNATAINYFGADETYMQAGAIPLRAGGDSPGALFFDYRWGIEYIDPTFASTAKLPKNTFLLQQIGVGIIIGKTIKISGERFFGPSQAYIDSSGNMASVDNFANWQLHVQLSPSGAK